MIFSHSLIMMRSFTVANTRLGFGIYCSDRICIAGQHSCMIAPCEGNHSHLKKLLISPGALIFNISALSAFCRLPTLTLKMKLTYYTWRQHSPRHLYSAVGPFKIKRNWKQRLVASWFQTSCAQKPSASLRDTHLPTSHQAAIRR